ncbi:hypothetical protein [Photobacterium angustum]|uniref:hypothetical protein n=1 Tax=Photobacterium angustum TaxID=661 RepID=UPI000B118B13|nr:hypothetical protein [Photobacterium angustum]
MFAFERIGNDLQPTNAVAVSRESKSTFFSKSKPKPRQTIASFNSEYSAAECVLFIVN